MFITELINTAIDLMSHKISVYFNINQAGLPSMEECLSKAKHLQQNSGSVKECVGLYLLSTEPEVGLEMGLKYVTGEVTYLEDVFYINVCSFFKILSNRLLHLRYN